MKKQSASRSKTNRSFMAMLKDRGGNFGVMAALATPLILAAGGVAIDLASLMTAKNQMQDAADAAALAAASSLVAKQAATPDQAKQIALNFLKAQSAGTTTDALGQEDNSELGSKNGGSPTDTQSAPTITITSTNVGKKDKAFKVTVVNKQTLHLNPMTRLLGKETIDLETVAVSESATETKNAMSMYLVLDRSGSMAFKTNVIDRTRTRCVNYDISNWGQRNPQTSSPCYRDKMTALKEAATEGLLKPLKTLNTSAVADSGKRVVRVGAVSYSSNIFAEEKLAWGTEKAATYVQNLVANGGTDSSDAFEKAYQDLKADNDAHEKESGATPRKYIVFMTDGDNNQYRGRDVSPGADGKSVSDRLTLESCKKAKDDGILVYAIAFMAPDRAKTVLQECASPGLFKAPEDAAALVKDFEDIGASATGKMARLTK